MPVNEKSLMPNNFWVLSEENVEYRPSPGSGFWPRRKRAFNQTSTIDDRSVLSGPNFYDLQQPGVSDVINVGL